MAQDTVSPQAVREKALTHHSPIPETPPTQEGVPSTPEMIALGKALYLDPRLSLSQFISCNSCHNLAMAGGDGQAVSVGHKWALDDRHAPTTLNAVFHIAQFWDGHSPNLKAQAHDPMNDPIEMAANDQLDEQVLASMPGYVEMFEAAFPDGNSQISMEKARTAIAAFEGTLITPNSLYDQFLEGDDTALTENQLAGLDLFIESGCAGCHSGVAMGGEKYEIFGKVNDPGEKYRPSGDTGRFEVTGDEADRYVFKVPSLRNVTLTAPYFHTGGAWELDEAIWVMGYTQLGIELSDDEIAKIVDFLQTTTGDLPVVELPNLPARTLFTPIPQPLGEGSMAN
ncbi:MAG: cytochrome-c peroxidase [Pseudomonadota bacterium]